MRSHLTCDASSHGLGAACLQDGKPVAYASRALSATQMKYAQIEKDMLAVVFACNKFHDYIYGWQVTIETDHKPLETLFKRCLSLVPQRLQKMMMQLQWYDLNVVYKKGMELYIADTLSRAHVEETAADKEDEYEVLMVTPIAPHRMVELKKETASDPQLAKLTTSIKNGWPESVKETDAEIQEFFNFREQLIIQDDIVYKGERIVVPSTLRSDYLKQIHQGHPGLVAMKNRVRDIFYWPSLSRDVNALVSQCSVCNAYKRHQQKEPLRIHEVPVRPWSVVASDLFVWNGMDYLITADSYSGWFELNT